MSEIGKTVFFNKIFRKIASKIGYFGYSTIDVIKPLMESYGEKDFYLFEWYFLVTQKLHIVQEIQFFIIKAKVTKLCSA